MLPDIVTHIVMPGHGGRGRRIMNFETTLGYLAVTHLVQGQCKALSQKTKIQQVPHSQRLFKVAFFLSFKNQIKTNSVDTLNEIHKCIWHKNTHTNEMNKMGTKI